MNPAPRIHVHLVSWTDEPWDVDESLFSLVTQEDVTATVSVSVPPALESRARETCASLARLGGPVELQPGPSSRWPPGVASCCAAAPPARTRKHAGGSHAWSPPAAT